MVAQFRPGSYPDLDAWTDRKKVVITLAGFYQNLGDMALTYAQKRFIEQTLPGYDVLLVPSTDTYSRMKALKRIVGTDDIITTIAGGNMDDIYTSLEDARRYVVRSFPNNPVISFPQTIAFSDTPEGQVRLRRSARTYAKHPRLTIFGREPRTLELMQSGLVGSRIEYSPDIVLSLKLDNPPTERKGLMLTVRKDKEVLLTETERDGIREVVYAKSDDVIVRDTVDVALEDCQPDTFEKTLEDFWALLRTRKVVVTDRLHCMIFCAITKTPCVVLPNSNHKIKGTYETWLQDHSYLIYLDKFSKDSLSNAIDTLMELQPEQITAPDLSPHYQALREALLEAADRA